jgi:hypothetical protein
MLKNLIQLAEEIYAVDPDTGVRLGILIEEVGKTLNYYHTKCQELHEERLLLNHKIKQLENEILAIRTLQ